MVAYTVRVDIGCTLIANAVEHAFPDAAAGQIRVALRRLHDESVLLSVSDARVICAEEPSP